MNCHNTVFTQSIWTGRSEQTVDPDQTPQNAASDQDLLFVNNSVLFDTRTGGETDFLKLGRTKL